MRHQADITRHFLRNYTFFSRYYLIKSRADLERASELRSDRIEQFHYYSINIAQSVFLYDKS